MIAFLSKQQGGDDLRRQRAYLDGGAEVSVTFAGPTSSQRSCYHRVEACKAGIYSLHFREEDCRLSFCFSIGSL